ncbi:MAG: DUF5906 domain-containing protein [Paludibacteraceae bacterium]|nr:DUF5906 domain-containing protein [Paludibacteraceae bacterium]
MDETTTITPTEERSYFQRRIFDEMGLTPEQNKVMLKRESEGDEFRTARGRMDIFSEDKDGNIQILVYTLNGWAITYPDPNQGKTYDHSSITKLKNYYVTRLHPDNIKEGGGKYRFPKGQPTYPFFPPNLLEKFEKQEQIDTLILTEGYFKAMTASLYGMDVVGLGSITLFADSNTKELYPDIKKLINTCKVHKVVLLYDGDCLNISEKALEKKQDLAKRPKTFYNAVKNTRDLLVDFSKVRIEFAYIRSDNLFGNPKGLDDLLLADTYKKHTQDIIDDLISEDVNSRFFFRMNVRDQINRLKRQFALETVDAFYKRWEHKIGDGEFVFERMVYQYNATEDKVIRAMPLAIKDFIRVGDDYYEMIQMPNIRTNNREIKLVPRKKGTIVDDFGKDQLRNVRKYKAFINKPSHLEYKAVIDDCYNLYHPINYVAEQNCPWPHIKKLMEHIFGEQVELGYDYMQLLYRNPMQILPILCLVSQERGTGKTTFLDLIREIYGNNAIIVGNSEITSEFNALVSGKLVVGVDETSLEDNTKVTERLKMMSTAKKVPMQRKGKDHEEIENFTKYVLCSNNETRFIYTQEDEIRFWVRKVEPIPKEENIPDILPVLSQEIPGFLSFLLSRQMHIREAQSRMWFKPEDIETEALLKLKAAQQPLPVREMKETIRTLFMDFPAEEYIISIKVLKLMVDEIQRIPSDIIRGYLKTNLGVTTALDENGIAKTKYIKIPYSFQGSDGKEIKAYHTDRAKGFIFRAENFLDEAEMAYVRKVLANLN